MKGKFSHIPKGKMGGKRVGAGRKPTTDKLVYPIVGIRESVVKQLGGMRGVEEMIRQHVRDVME